MNYLSGKINAGYTRSIIKEIRRAINEKKRRFCSSVKEYAAEMAKTRAAHKQHGSKTTTKIRGGSKRIQSHTDGRGQQFILKTPANGTVRKWEF